VNSYKHGDGGAFEEIKRDHPEFISHFDPDFIKYADHSSLEVTEAHIAEFSNAVRRFWEGIPEHIMNEDHINAPTWFLKALEKD
jgi:hypothetical protein